MRRIEVQAIQEIKVDRRATKKPRTLLLSDEIFVAIDEWCENENQKIKAQNLERMKKPPSQRPRKLPLIKPCDVIDRLLEKFKNGEVTLK